MELSRMESRAVTTQPLFSCCFKNFLFNTNKRSQESGSPLRLMSNEAEGGCDGDCKIFSLRLAILLHTFRNSWFSFALPLS